MLGFFRNKVIKYDILTQIIVWTLAIVISTFSPGVTVFRVLCGCEGKTQVSLISFSDPCQTKNTHQIQHSETHDLTGNFTECSSQNTPHNEIESSSCCEVVHKPHISDTPTENCSHNITLTDDCCESHAKIFQLDESIENPRNSLEDIHLSTNFLIPFCVIFLDVFGTSLLSQTDLFSSQVSLSPPEYGRTLLQKLHIWRN